MHIKCDPHESTLPDMLMYYGGYDLKNSSFAPVMNTKSTFGCHVFSMKDFYAFLKMISEPLGATEIGLGFVLCFLGRVMIKPALFMIGLISGTLGFCLIYFMLIYKASYPMWWVWVVFSFGIIIGIVLGTIFF